jgi:hypothetical protein
MNELVVPNTPEIRNGVKAFMSWIKDYSPKPIFVERRLFSKQYEFVGTLDLLAEIRGKVCLVDYKAGGLYSSVAFQTAAQKLCLEEEGIHVDERYALQLSPETGEYKFLQLTHDKRDRDAFLGALYLKRGLDCAAKSDFIYYRKKAAK